MLEERKTEKFLFDLKPVGDINKDKKIIQVMLKVCLPLLEGRVERYNVFEDYYYNKTDVLGKVKVQQEYINNKIAIGYPSLAVITLTGNCIGNKLTYASRKSATDIANKIKMLNDSFDDDNYHSKTTLMALNSGIYSTGYKLVIPANKNDLKNNIYFKTKASLSPKKNFCVYFNDVEEEKIFGVNVKSKKFYNKTLTGYTERDVYTIWTKYHQWQCYAFGNGYKFIEQQNGIIAYPIVSKRIPLVENFRKPDGTNDFELAFDLINAVNALASTRVDAVQQTVDFLVLLRDIDTESEGALSRVKEQIRQGIMSFKSNEGAVVQPSVDILSIKLNQTEVQTLQDFLCKKIEEVLFIPNRDNSNSIGGDTGIAVENRNGFRSLSNISGLILTNILEVENEVLDIILAICDNITSCPFKGLRPNDVEIKDNIMRTENIQMSANAYSTLRNAGMADEIALLITGVVPDPMSVAGINKKEKEKNGLNDNSKNVQPNINKFDSNSNNAVE